MTHAPAENKKTPLYDVHKSSGAKIVEFGGWLMPVSYEGVLAEHQTVRTSCGLFDVSHMGEVRVKGRNAAEFMQFVTINDISKLKIGQGQYSAILKPNGGMIDDLIVYRLGEQEFFVCVNASNSDKDFEWLDSQSERFDVTVTNESKQWAQLAVQGPHSQNAVKALLDQETKTKLDQLPYTWIMEGQFGGKKMLIARTGYTGERGYEIYVDPTVATKAWEGLMSTNPSTGIKPIGLGARDTLRLEACYLLYGNDMNETVSPLEAGIGWATKIEKGAFIGRDVLTDQKAKGVKRHIVCIKMNDDGIPRHDMDVFFHSELVGKVTSGSVLPTIGGAGGMALVASHVKEGDHLEIDVRGKRKGATVVKRPLYNAKVK